MVSDLCIETHGRGRPRLSDRLLLDGVLWMLFSGAAWRDMPDRFGPCSTVYQRFLGWRNQETFDQMIKRLHLRLNEQGLIDLQTWIIDSTAVPATRASIAGEGKDTKEREPLSPQALSKAVALCKALDDEPRWTTAMIADTGARLAEIVDLPLNDIVLDAKVPHIVIQEHPWRTRTASV